MGMTIDEAVLELRWLKKVNQEILETDAKELDVDSAWIKHWESVTQALDSAVDTMRKYQQLQADYENRLKADMVAMLTDIQLEIEELPFDDEEPINITREYMDEVKAWGYGKKDCVKVIQQKIDALKEQTDESD